MNNKNPNITQLPKFSKMPHHIQEYLDINASKSRMSTGISRPDVANREVLSPEKKAERKRLVDSCDPYKRGTILVLRHRLKEKTDGGLFMPLDSMNHGQSKMTTATILKVAEGVDLLVPNDKVHFSEYAPWSPFSDFPEIQLLHEQDVILKLKEIPKDREEDSLD